MRAISMVLLLSSLLVGCSGSKEDDLDQFIQESGNDFRSKIDPLPEVQPFFPLPFNADGKVNDPFKPRKAEISKGDEIQPDLERPREPLEAFPLENLKYVGEINKEKKRYALIKAPDGSVHQVTVGNYLGQNLGIITELSDTEIKLKEIVRDELSGDWVERTASITMQE